MKVTPLEIQQKRFHVAFRGYDRNEVDLFLETVREEMEDLLREVTELRDFHQTYDERMREFRDREETLKNTLLTTHKLAEDIKVNARREADVIVKNAELKFQQTMEQARQEKARLDAEVQELQRRKHHFLQDMKKMIQMHLEMIDYEGAGSEATAGQGNGQQGA